MRARSLPVRSPYGLDRTLARKVSHGLAKNLPTTASEEGRPNIRRKDGMTTNSHPIVGERLLWSANLTICSPGGGMADTKDSKSFALTGVRVQIPLRAQKNTKLPT